jgi:hypothetical protein
MMRRSPQQYTNGVGKAIGGLFEGLMQGAV